MDPIGYKIGLEILVKCGCREVAEVPIHFSDRVHGDSKLNFSEQWKYLAHLKRLYGFKLSQLFPTAKPVFKPKATTQAN